MPGKENLPLRRPRSSTFLRRVARGLGTGPTPPEPELDQKAQKEPSPSQKRPPGQAHQERKQQGSQEGNKAAKEGEEQCPDPSQVLAEILTHASGLRCQAGSPPPEPKAEEERQGPGQKAYGPGQGRTPAQEGEPVGQKVPPGQEEKPRAQRL
jgi:hypothetical protein